MIRRLFLLFLCFSPLSVRAGVREDLRHLYPEQSPGVLEGRIAQMENPDDFFRAFGPYFHAAVRGDILTQNPFRAFAGQTTWCAGDAHPENFGILLDLSGRGYFLLNDLDDNGPCPVVADLLRFLTGVALKSQSDVLTEPLLKSYFAGWNGSSVPVPNAIRGLIREGMGKGLVPKSSWIDKKTGMLKANHKELRTVPPAIQNDITSWLSGLSAELRLLDLRERVKLDGGSGGLVRYLALLGRGRDRVLLEFKQLSRPSTFVYGLAAPDPARRVATGWAWAQGPVRSGWNQFATVGGLSFFTRLVWDGNLNLDLKDFAVNDQAEIALYEAALLGQLHRSAVATESRATNPLEAVPASAWQAAVAQMVVRMQRAFAEL